MQILSIYVLYTTKPKSMSSKAFFIHQRSRIISSDGFSIILKLRNPMVLMSQSNHIFLTHSLLIIDLNFSHIFYM